MLRGNYAAKIDDKGRLKIPNAFRALVEKTHGSELFVTSLTGESVRVYPMPVWLALEETARRAPPPRIRPAISFLDRVNYFGQTAEIDAQGRVVIHQRLREIGGHGRRSGRASAWSIASTSGTTSASSRRCRAIRSPTTTRGRCRSSGSDA